MLYGYKGPAYTFEYFLERWQTIVKQSVSPTKLFNEIIKREENIKNKQMKLLSQLKFNFYQLKLIRMAQKIIFIKEFRKGALYHGMYCYEPFFREVAKRLGITLKHVWAMSPWEIPLFLTKGRVFQKELDKRLKEAVCYINKKKHVVWAGKRAQEFFKRIPKEKIPSKDEVNELIGSCASPGYAKGIVKIIEAIEDMPKMRKGDILVSETTYPGLVPVMKKAGAIITNAGGLTSHAAIVSRELGIPCVVGTKIANKVLKDGDVVEVNATKGYFRIIK